MPNSKKMGFASYREENTWLLRFFKSFKENRNKLDLQEYEHVQFFYEWMSDNYPELLDSWLSEDSSKSPEDPEEAFREKVRGGFEPDAELVAECEKEAGDKIDSLLEEGHSRRYFDLNTSKLIPRQTWLVHFTDNAYNIAHDGFKY